MLAGERHSCSQTCHSKPLSIMKFVISGAFLLLAVSLSNGLPFPGMIAWVCKSCPNPNMLYTADAEMTSPSGKPVGNLRLQQSVPRDQASTETFPLTINTVNNRVKLDNMKTSYFMVQIQAGSCDSLGEVLVSQYCRGCTNSLGVSLTGKGGESLALEEMVGNSVVFFDSKNTNAKLACGEIKNGHQDESA